MAGGAGNIRAGAAYVEIFANSDALDRGLKGAQDKLRSFGNACASAGRDMLVFAGLAAAPLAMAVKSFASFDDSMRLVRAVTRATAADFAMLTETAQRLGRETSFSAQEVADAMVSLGRMGFNPAEIDASIASVLNLARATGTDLAQSGDIAANSMRIFGIAAENMGHVSDVLTVTANSSAQTLTDLFEALKMGGPQAKAAGESIEDTCASIAVLANMGIKGSLAGTALRKSFSQFTKVKVQEKLDAVGVKTVDANGNLRKMADIIRDLAGVMSALPTADKLAFAEEIFDIRGSLAGLTLTADTKGLDEMLAKLRDVDGAAAETAKSMDAGLGGSFRLFVSAVEGVKNALGEVISTSLQPLTDKVTGVLNVFTQWIQQHKTLVTAFAAMVAGAAALGVALIAVGLAAKGAAAGFEILEKAHLALAAVQGKLATAFASLQGWFGTISTAFAEYGNAAMPALVGTERLCGALGLASTEFNRAAAGVLMMGNAEAAAAAKSTLANVWTKMSGALKGLTAASIANAVATKSRAMAETAGAVATSLSSGVTRVAAAVTALFSVSQIKAAASVAATSAGNFILAASAKVAAAAMLTLSAVCNVIAAHPVATALIALGAVLVGLCVHLKNAASYTAELSDASQRLREKNDETRKGELDMMARLEQLSEKQSLSNEETAEASKYIDALTSRYGDLGICLDKTSGKLTGVAQAQQRLNKMMRESAIGEIDAEILELQSNNASLGRENDALDSYWNNTAWAHLTGKYDESVAKYGENTEKMTANRMRISALQKRKKALSGGDGSGESLTGQKTAEQTAAERVEEEKRRRSASAAEATRAAEQSAEIERRLRRESQTELENEIEDIIELRNEYRRLLQTQLEFEKSKADSLQDKGRIAALEAKLKEADKTADAKIKAAKAKAGEKEEKGKTQKRERMREDAASFRGNFDRMKVEIEERRKDDAEEREIDEKMKADPKAGTEALVNLIRKYEDSMARIEAEFNDALIEAQSDGEMDDSERESLRELTERFSKASNAAEKYRGKLESAGDAVRGETKRDAVGSFTAEALKGLFSASGTAVETADERIAKATEETAKNTKKLVKAQSSQTVDVG